MTPEESDAFFSLLSGRVVPWPLKIAEELQEHVRGCALPIAGCNMCRLCELELKADLMLMVRARQELRKKSQL